MKITKEQEKEILNLFDFDPYDDWGEGKQQGMIDLLDVLNIKIEGINHFTDVGGELRNDL